MLHSVANLNVFLKLDEATQITDHGIDLLTAELLAHKKKNRLNTDVFDDTSDNDSDSGQLSHDDFTPARRPLPKSE